MTKIPSSHKVLSRHYEVSRINKDDTKRFRIGNGNHTSIFTEDEEMEWARKNKYIFTRL